MTPIRCSAIAGLCALLSIACGALAQQVQNPPHIGFAFPAGGKAGSEFEVVIGGQFLDGISEAHITGGGAAATLVEYIKPVSVGQVVLLRDKLNELLDKKREAEKAAKNGGKSTWTEADEKAITDIRKKIADYQRRPTNPAIQETVRISVKLESDAKPGQRELRLVTPSGLTNPLSFHVSQLPEVNESEHKTSSAALEMNVTLPCVANGQIMPGDADRYRFKVTKGQKLVVIAAARDLIPYLPDAVPGWFQATLAMYDSKGREIGYADDFRFSPDPIIFYEVPQDDEYVVEIRDSIYRGREDFVYRLSMGELPYVTGVFPLGGKVGTPSTVELKGWNLPVTSMTVDNKALGIIQLTGKSKDGLVSNKMPFQIDMLAEVNEAEPNNDRATAQKVTLPANINGHIDQPGDWDVYKFEGRAGERIVAEVFARRLNSPVDSIVKLTDSSGRQIAFNDDHEDKAWGLETHHADSYVSAILPASGTFYVHIGDTQRQGGPEFAYRLRLGWPRPDFELRVVPSSIVVKAGNTVPITIHALRKDGFVGDIALSLDDAPAGFVLSGAKIPANQDQLKLTLTAPPTAMKEHTLSITGKANVQGKMVVKKAVPAEDMMQAFFYRHLVTAENLTVVVPGGRFSPKNPMKIVSPLPIRIPTSGIAKVYLEAPQKQFGGHVTVELSDPPEGITVKQVTNGPMGAEIQLQADPKKIKPGTKGNLIFNLLLERSAGPKSKPGQKKAAPIGTLPAAPFEVTAY